MNPTAARLLDTVIANQRLRNDAALARFLELSPPAISKMRHGVIPVSASNIILIHEKTDMSIREIKGILAAELALT